MDEVPGKINDEQKQSLNDIVNSGRNLLSLINDMLDLSKIEAGKVELVFRNVSLHNVIESLVSEMQSIITPREQILEVYMDEGLPPVRADRAKVRQVLLNLLSNATKFTPDGGKLKIEAVRDDNWVQVSVIDTGIGIKNEDKEKIFEEFYQLDNPLSEDKSGTGLGLTIARQIINKHGGRIWVESEYGKGSRFIFTLPVVKND